MSEILSVTGRDVPAMPRDEHEWARWLAFFYPVLAGLKALSHSDWPALALWSTLLIACGFRLWLGPLGGTPRPWPQPVKVAALIFAVVPAVLVETGKTPWMRWMGVALAAAMITAVFRPWNRARR